VDRDNYFMTLTFPKSTVSLTQQSPGLPSGAWIKEAPVSGRIEYQAWKLLGVTGSDSEIRAQGLPLFIHTHKRAAATDKPGIYLKR
jgi:hypothetical protein